MTAVLFVLGIVMFVLAAGCLVADKILPRLPWVERYIDTLPLMRGERK